MPQPLQDVFNNSIETDGFQRLNAMPFEPRVEFSSPDEDLPSYPNRRQGVAGGPNPSPERPLRYGGVARQLSQTHPLRLTIQPFPFLHASTCEIRSRLRSTGMPSRFRRGTRIPEMPPSQSS